MSTVVQPRVEAQLTRTRMPDPAAIGLWLVASLITAFFALLLRDSAVIGDVHLPLTNDSFYHP